MRSRLFSLLKKGAVEAVASTKEACVQKVAKEFFQFVSKETKGKRADERRAIAEQSASDAVSANLIVFDGSNWTTKKETQNDPKKGRKKN